MTTTGIFYNLTLNYTKYDATDDTHSPNKNVNYIGVNFPGISFVEDGFSNLNIGENDYILFEIDIPTDNWTDKYNLLNITPYFYTYKGINVFASVNETLLFMRKKEIKKGSNNKICFTCSNKIGNSFKKKGYDISYIPVEYIKDASYLLLMRIGLVDNKEYAEIPSTFKATYYRSNIKTNYLEVPSIEYSTQLQILSLLPKRLQPITSDEHNLINNNFVEIFKSFHGYINHRSFEYFSNVYGTNYAFKSFYDSLKVYPYANIELNNTKENYYNSNYIKINKEFNNKYYYLFCLNQKRTGCGLTSSVQIYDFNTKLSIYNIDTAGNLPPLSQISYPRSIRDICESATFYLIEFPESFFQTDKIYLLERIAYDPVNFNSCDSQYINAFNFFYGNKMSLETIISMKSKYDLKFIQN
jgi:hypothetical protein